MLKKQQVGGIFTAAQHESLDGEAGCPFLRSAEPSAARQSSQFSRLLAIL
jgi:hypothetical protein